MELPIIKSYPAYVPNCNFSFYVLSKGENAGKPLEKPCPNCFTVSCSSSVTREYWFWLSWGLWKSRSFHYYLRGSVIPFIRITDYREAIVKAMRPTIDNPQQFATALETMRQIELYEQQSKEKLEKLALAKIAIFRKLLHRS